MAAPSLIHKESGDGGENPNVDQIAKAISNNTTRKRLADISNFPQQSKPSGQAVAKCTKKSIEELLKENMALMKLLADRNKIIEVRGFELQNLRINLQKFQQQNLQLAQANSQLMAEHNSDKDRLKTLQHELACINGVLKARNVDIHDKADRKACQNTFNEEGKIKCEKPEGLSKEDRNDEQQHKEQSLCPSTTKQVQGKDKADNIRKYSRRQSARFRSREPESTEDLFETDNAKQLQAIEKADNKRRTSRRQSGRFRSGEPGSAEELPEMDDTKQVQALENADKKRHTSRRQSATFKSGQPDCPEELFEIEEAKQVQAKRKADNKRHCPTKRSARFKSLEPECTEDSFETDDDKFPVSALYNDQMHGSDSKSLDSSVKDDKEGNIASRYETQEFRRSSIERPLRRAAVRVQSYKEIPLNVKMRRSE